jgi:hypothetical protein
MSNQQDEVNAKLLAIVENTGSEDITINGITDKDLWDYVKQQIKDNYQKPKRISGRREPPEKEEIYKPPVGLFNLGNNSMYFKDLKEEKKIKQANLKDIETVGEEDDFEVKNNVKMGPDGKLFFVEEDQGDKNAEEEQLKFNLEIKNDLPWQIYRKINHFGRLTLDELCSMYKAIEKPMFIITVRDMVNKRYLKKVKEIDQIVEFNDDATDLKDFTKVKEIEVETFEIVAEDERRQVLS